MQVLGLVLLGILLLVLESSLFYHLKVAGVRPDLLLIVVVFYGLQRGRTKGFLLGLIYGGLEDLISGHFLGSNALIKLIIGFFSGVAQDRLNRDNIYVFIFLVLVATLAKFVLFFMLVATSYAWLPALCDILLPEMAYNGAMAFLASGFRQEGGDLLKWLAGKKRRGGES